MKKRALLFSLAALLILSLAVGCSKPAAEGEKPAEEPAKKLELLYATGGTAGTYYPLGGAMANVWNENISSINVTVQPSGASIENIKLLATGQADVCMAMNNIADAAWKGEGEFAQPLQNFRAVGVVYPEVVQGVALKEANITKPEDMKGKKVALGPTGSGTQAATKVILQAVGMSESDVKGEYATFGDAVMKMKDGQLDAAWNVIAAPGAAIVDLNTSRDITMIEIDDETLERIREIYPLVTRYVIPGGTYRSVPNDVNTISFQAVLYVREDLPEDVVYEMTKVMYEKNAEIGKGHAMGGQITIDKALDGITTDFHPGAIKYYKEKGVM
ncbi:MAG: TRAP transporter solute receptor, TAXI family precursor [Firmicutes bacterium]|nr:TRAP transporter solute receptor, TAXI family precursor [Bacillota bacterium]MDI6707356.1 TAXI family TRAP transporter solute-binding subunit [Bacillota bacterium]